METFPREPGKVSGLELLLARVKERFGKNKSKDKSVNFLLSVSTIYKKNEAMDFTYLIGSIRIILLFLLRALIIRPPSASLITILTSPKLKFKVVGY